VFSAIAQKNADIISGPMLGHIELRTAQLWVEAKPGTPIEVYYWKKDSPNDYKIARPFGSNNVWFEPLKFYLTDLTPATVYYYAFATYGRGNKRPSKADGQFTTTELWQWRKAAPDFSFLAGSCAFFNDPIYDRPGNKPYGGDSSIFETMATEQANFMLWLGDNWYTREVDYGSEWGLYYRASKTRAMPIMSKFFKAMPHYAIWDDHDFGPNDYDKSYIHANTSREVFNNYWSNPSSGENEKGIYTMFKYSDCDFYLLDDRTWRSNDAMPDSVNGKPNPNKRMLGEQQMEWLKNQLLANNRRGKSRPEQNATFKIICLGSQVLNPVSTYDKFKNFTAEYYELMQFIKDNKINGVVFFSGDRHHTEIIKVDQNGAYPLYDVTISPLTSGSHYFGGPEKNNPYRVLGVDNVQNYGRCKVTGADGDRKLTIEVVGIKGDKLGEYTINQKELNW
jgi:alkaline phosphatase D